MHEPIDFLSKLILYPKHMEMTLSLDILATSLSQESLDELQKILDVADAKLSSSESELHITLNIKAQYKRSGGQLFIITENGRQIESSIDAQHHYPDDKTFAFIAKSFYWNKQVENGVYKTIKDISTNGNNNFEYIKKSFNQKYLSPKIISTITSNDEPTQIAVERLIQCRHWSWQKQEQLLLAHPQN